jgi:purine-cytosine permease-like protein
MENVEAQAVEGQEARPLSPALKAVIIAGFGIPCVVHLLFGRWMTASFFVFSLFFSLRAREIDRWPKPKRYAFVVLYLAFAAAMLVEVYWQVRPLLWPAR